MLDVRQSARAICALSRRAHVQAGQTAITLALPARAGRYGATSSTRRFSARPASVALEPAGASKSDTRGAQPRRTDAVVLHQLGGDRFGAPSRQIKIVGVGALVVGVADDEDVEPQLGGQQLRDLFERRAAFRLHLGLVGIEIDAIERDVAGLAEALGHAAASTILFSIAPSSAMTSCA